MNTELNSLDSFIHSADWLQARELPVAIELTETLEPAASGPEVVVFPPTYARKDDSGVGHPYAIDIINKDLNPSASEDGKLANICTLDSVGSQANRMEPAFAHAPLSSLVPQISFAIGTDSVSLLELGHRLADGTVRCSDLADISGQAIAAWAKNGNAQPIALLAPTSLVFGFWDSRESGLKAGRVIASTIRATNVSPLKRSATYFPAPPLRGHLDAAKESGELEADTKALSDLGMEAAPSVDTHGGVIVHGTIQRRTEINLVALRSLMVRTEDGQLDADSTLALRRYVLGLALVAATAQSSYDLRQGCLLVRKAASPAVSHVVRPTGERADFPFTFEQARTFAAPAAAAFGIGTNRDATFEIQRLRDNLVQRAAGAAGKKAAKKAAAKKAATPANA